MYGNEVAYVALVARDVEATARFFEKDYGLRRTNKIFDGRQVPMLSVGKTALAIFAEKDPFVGGQSHTGVHHIALAVSDVEKAMGDIQGKGVKFETEKLEASLDGGQRCLISLEATNGIKTYITRKIDAIPSHDGFIERIDHLGIMGTDNPRVLDTLCHRLGCELTGEQFDTEMQISVEHFVYKNNRTEKTVVHTRPADIVANVHDLFILTGDLDLEVIQPMNTSSVYRASGTDAGNTKQDHGVVDQFLKKHGPGLHHVAFKVSEIDPCLQRMEASGYRMIDRKGRPGARLSRIGFIHPTSTQGVLTHFVERPDL